MEKGGKIRLVGGRPSEENYEGLRVLKSLGAEFRFLDEPPVTHLFACYEKSNEGSKPIEKSIFIWLEGHHRDNIAMAILYSDSPTEEQGELAKMYFDKL